jgi:hypothetical protein
MKAVTTFENKRPMGSYPICPRKRQTGNPTFRCASAGEKPLHAWVCGASGGFTLCSRISGVSQSIHISSCDRQPCSDP